MSNYSEIMVWNLFDAGYCEEQIATQLGVSVDLVESTLGGKEDEYPQDAADAAYEECEEDEFASLDRGEYGGMIGGDSDLIGEW